MSLKLIKEAQLNSTISAERKAVLEVLKDVVGVKSLSELMEAFRPSGEDYTKWLEVIAGYAEEEGVPINTKGSFADVASAVLDNDPANPPEEMRAAIINKLWNDHKGAKHTNKVEKIAKAQEDEEAVRNAARSMMGRHRGDENEEDVYGASQGEESQHEIPSDGEGSDIVGDSNEEDDMFGYYIVNNGKVVTGPFDEEEDAYQALNDETNRGNEEENDSNDDKVLLGRADEDGYFVPSLDDIGEPHEDRISLGPVVLSTGSSPQENEEKSVPRYFTSKQTTEKADSTSMLQQAITTPREHISDALKKVEQEGKDAWKAHGVPKNPHPPKTMAHKSWEKGLKNAVKSEYGIDKPVLVTPSRKR